MVSGRSVVEEDHERGVTSVAGGGSYTLLVSHLMSYRACAGQGRQGTRRTADSLPDDVLRDAVDVDTWSFSSGSVTQYEEALT